MRRFVIFWNYGSPLEPLFLGKSGKVCLRLSPVAWTVMLPLWLNEGMEVFPQYISGLFD
jgi:hypothetical protein